MSSIDVMVASRKLGKTLSYEQALEIYNYRRVPTMNPAYGFTKSVPGIDWMKVVLDNNNE